MVVHDALLLVDHANRQAGSLDPAEAIAQAGVRRLRPILLTTLTTFGGLTPNFLERSSQADRPIPLAISLGFGRARCPRAAASRCRRS